MLSALIGTAVILKYEIKDSAQELIEGPNSTQLDKTIALHMLDSVVVGLKDFHIEHGHYPQINGKYFFDSVKQYIRVSDVLVYADTIEPNGTTRATQQMAGSRFDYQTIPHTYIGIGRSEYFIVYRTVPPDSYLLYWIGRNGIDEGGAGDDLLSKP